MQGNYLDWRSARIRFGHITLLKMHAGCLYVPKPIYLIGSMDSKSGSKDKTWTDCIYSTNCGHVYTQMQTFTSSTFSLITLIHSQGCKSSHWKPTSKRKFQGILQTTAVSCRIECIYLQNSAIFCTQLQTAANYYPIQWQLKFTFSSCRFWIYLDVYTFPPQFALYIILTLRTHFMVKW